MTTKRGYSSPPARLSAPLTPIFVKNFFTFNSPYGLGLWCEKMRPHARIGQIYIKKSIATQQQPSLTWQFVPQDQAVIWTVSNPTNTSLSTAIWRGVPNYAPTYFFGGAFNMVYLANGVPSCAPPQEFCLGILKNPDSLIGYPAFVFNLPPNTSYSIEEFGFTQQAAQNIQAELVILNPGPVKKYVVYYDPTLPSMYMLEIGMQVGYLPSPYSIITQMYLTPKFYPNTFNYWVLEDNILTKNPFMKALYTINLITAQIANALNTT